jgi:arginine decarboxylase
VIIPSERVTAALLDYLATGLAAGMRLPEPADLNLRTIRVVARTAPRRRRGLAW